MGKHYCDYCDVYLTHDSTSVRKAHNTGRNHIQNVRDYYMSLDPSAATAIVAELTKAYDAAGVQNPPALIPGAPGFGMTGPFGGAPGPAFAQGGAYGAQMGYRPPMMGGPGGMQPFRPFAQAPPNAYSQPPPSFPLTSAAGGPGGMYARPPPHLPPPGMMGMPGTPPPLGMARPPPSSSAGMGTGMPPPLGMAGRALHMRPPPNFSVPPPGFGGR